MDKPIDRPTLSNCSVRSTSYGVGKIAQQVKELAAKPVDLCEFGP